MGTKVSFSEFLPGNKAESPLNEAYNIYVEKI